MGEFEPGFEFDRGEHWTMYSHQELYDMIKTDAKGAAAVQGTLDALDLLKKKDSIDSYRRIVADLDRVALGEGHTHAWLVHLAKTLGEPREDHDEQPPEEPCLEEEFLHQ